MVSNWLNPNSTARSGYALVVVLFSLTILTLIFGVASTRTLAHIERTQTDRLLSQNQSDIFAASELLLAMGLPEDRVITLDMQDRALTATLQPATGLVDLNTVAPALLRLLLDGYELPNNTILEALERYRSWKREGRKLLRVSDFYRVTRIEPSQLPGLEGLTTVYSGRAGVAADHVSTALLEHLTDSIGARDTLLDQLDPSLITPGSFTNVHVRLLGNAQRSSVVHFGPSPSQSRIIEMR